MKQPKPGGRFGRFIATILMVAVMTLASFGSAFALGLCRSDMMLPAEAHGEHVHGLMPVEFGHMTMRHGAADHRAAKHQPPCCNTNCLACVPAILTAEVGIPPQSAVFAFDVAADTFALGRSPSPLLGPPRSRI